MTLMNTENVKSRLTLQAVKTSFSFSWEIGFNVVDSNDFTRYSWTEPEISTSRYFSCVMYQFLFLIRIQMNRW